MDNINTSNTFPNSLYPPLGTNDNNFNRQGVPSNIFPYNGEMTGNPLGRFNPGPTNDPYLTAYNNQNQQFSNFTKAYAPTQQLIEKIDYTNQNNLLHNNVGDLTLGENIIEYRINIDSLDRDIRYYPNPFSFTVKFSPASNGIYKDREGDYSEIKMYGTPTPYIDKRFRNVKYVKLENIVLPQYSRFKKNKHGEYEPDPEYHLSLERFINLEIKELNYDRVYTTSSTVTRISKTGQRFTPPTPYAIIIPDKCIGPFYYAGTPYYGSTVYKNSLLSNLNQLTIKFYDSYGEPITLQNTYTYDQLQQYEYEHGEPLPISDIRHPYNKKIQLNFSLIVGVVESEITTGTKYEK